MNGNAGRRWVVYRIVGVLGWVCGVLVLDTRFLVLWRADYTGLASAFGWIVRLSDTLTRQPDVIKNVHSQYQRK